MNAPMLGHDTNFVSRAYCPFQRKRPGQPFCACCGLGVLRKLRGNCPYWLLLAPALEQSFDYLKIEEY
jgi:hypothetical protein